MWEFNSLTQADCVLEPVLNRNDHLPCLLILIAIEQGIGKLDASAVHRVRVCAGVREDVAQGSSLLIICPIPAVQLNKPMKWLQCTRLGSLCTFVESLALQ